MALVAIQGSKNKKSSLPIRMATRGIPTSPSYVPLISHMTAQDGHKGHPYISFFNPDRRKLL